MVLEPNNAKNQTNLLLCQSYYFVYTSFISIPIINLNLLQLFHVTQNLRFISVSVSIPHIHICFSDELRARFCSIPRLEILISLPLNQPNNFYVFATFILHDSTPLRQFRFTTNLEFSNHNSLSFELYAIGADIAQQPNQFTLSWMTLQGFHQFTP